MHRTWSRLVLAAIPRLMLSIALLALAAAVGLRIAAPPAEIPIQQQDEEPMVQAGLALRTDQEAQEDLADRFLAAWAQGRYKDMYQLLSTASRKGLSEAQFTRQYKDLLAQGGISAVSASTERFSLRELSRVKPPGVEEVPFTTTFETAQMGRFSDRNFLPMVKEKTNWRVQWSPAVIMRDFAAKGKLALRLGDGTPLRGTIFDSAGQPLARTERIITVATVPGRMNDEAHFLSAVSDVLGISQEDLKAKYDKMPYNWLISLGEVSADRREEVDAKLGTVSGLVIEEIARRVYPRDTLASPAVGFVGQYSSGYRDDARMLEGAGYRDGDWLGRLGVEQWGERILAGIRGGSLALRAPDGGSVRLLSQQPARDGKDIALALNAGLQQAAELSLGDRTGAIVILDIARQAVVAAASTPAFSPNAYSLNPMDQRWRWLMSGRESAAQNRVVEPYPVAPLVSRLLHAGGSVEKWLNVLHLIREVPGLSADRNAALLVRGEPEASPLQVAAIMAALAGDGRVRTPVFVTQVLERDGRVDQQFEPKDQGSLPLTAEAQQWLRNDLNQTIMLEVPFEGLVPPAAGLEGRSSEFGRPDWFAGYTPAEQPQYAVAVLVEDAVDGMPNASNIARTLLELIRIHDRTPAS